MAILQEKMIPKQYQWLNSLTGLPKTIQIGLAEYGVTEVVGKGSNRTIIGWRDELNGAAPAGKPLVKGFSDDDIPWCGLFAAIIAYRRVGNLSEVPSNPLWARNWTRYGVPANRPSLGDILVFTRGTGGHVAFYIGEDSTCFHVLGGNQSNRVSITRIQKSRLLASRRPPYINQPASVKPYHLTAVGKISANEA
jgi:uncharacterized protein (TIGR02594 family)